MREMTLEETKQCVLEALLWVDNYCRERNITWWLCGGTLLGAVRHKGFIPWDDDIDIMLPREDYERLCAEFPKNERYRLLRAENTENFHYTFGKIEDTLTRKDENIRKKYTRIGLDIDVFPIDNLPSDDEECKAYYNEISRIGLKLAGMTIVYGKGKTLKSTIQKNIYIFCQRFLEIIGINSYERTRNKFLELSQRYNDKPCEYWGITCIDHYGIKERNKKKGYDETVKVEFEGHLFPAPACYDTYLSQLYGKDYMQLPPEEKRVTHHSFKAFWK